MYFKTNEECAYEFCEAIKKLASKPENLENLESYLSQHFHVWLQEHATEPEDFVAEMSLFANMEV